MREVSSPRILIVEDEIKLLDHLSQTLSEEGLSNFTCSSIRELQNLLELLQSRFDLIILDRLLQGKDSAVLVGEIKSKMPECQIMILSAINTSSEKAAVLDMGADDYLSKPFDSNELIARVRALLRRSKVELKYGNVVLNSNNRSMIIDTQEIPLPNKEFILMRTLLQTPGKIFNKTFLYEQVWEMSTDVESNVVEATVNKLRKRLIECGATISIKNARNVGYWIEE